MKLLQYAQDGELRLGVKTERGIADVRATAEAFPAAGAAAPRTMREALAGGDEALKALAELLAEAGDRAATLGEAGLEFAPCVTEPQKIVCVGLNYRKHAEETNAPIPAYPILFNKYNNALTGHLADVALPEAVTSEVDYEAELAIVIGRRAKDVGVEEALGFVFGYCNANDLSARDLQMRTAQWMLGKTLDGFCPLGPYLVTADEVGDPNGLAIRCEVNGAVRQSSRTSDMIFRCDEIVSYVSRHMTLEPGDVILTGTPEGVVLGLPPERRTYLKAGDNVTVEIEGLGRLTNRMVAR